MAGSGLAGRLDAGCSGLVVEADESPESDLDVGVGAGGGDEDGDGD
jgi:hypothetical protein